jgi:hypothetical protein
VLGHTAITNRIGGTLAMKRKIAPPYAIRKPRGDDRRPDGMPRTYVARLDPDPLGPLPEPDLFDEDDAVDARLCPFCSTDELLWDSLDVFLTDDELDPLPERGDFWIST